MADPIKMIDNTQKKLIHIAKAQLKMSDETYREILSKYFWANTCKELNYNEASKLVDWLKERGFKIKQHRAESSEQRATKKKLPPTVTQLLSREQLKKIEMLKADIHWHAGPMGYTLWLNKYLKKDHITTSREAQNVIEAMKAMKQRQQRAKSLEHRDNGSQMKHDGGRQGGYWRW